MWRYSVKFSRIFHRNFRCPSARKAYTAGERRTILRHLDFKEQMQKGIERIKELQYYVSVISNNDLWDTDKKKLESSLYSIAEDPVIYYLIIDEINRIISIQW